MQVLLFEFDEGLMYMIDMLWYFMVEGCDFFFFIGVDFYFEFDIWWLWQELFELVMIVVLVRFGYDCQVFEDVC